MDIEDLEIYQIAIKISDLAWEVYKNFPKEFKYSTAQQFLKASDSVGANIAEGYGRFHYKDSMKFYYNSRGSLFELAYWNSQILKRKLISRDHYDSLTSLIMQEKIKLNKFIRTIKTKIK